MKTISPLFICICICLCLAACATKPVDNAVPPQDKQTSLPYSSPECLAAKLMPGDPFPSSAIPEAALNKRQSGWVAIRYDVVAGAAQNLVVVSSNPPGLYDAAAMQHAAQYRDAAKATVRGCVTMIEVKF